MRHSVWFILLALVLSCTTEEENMDNVQTQLPNILLIIADDMGKDATPGYLEGDLKPNTPNLDQIRNAGLTFQNLWVSPTCSPTRASILTGKYGYRTGVKQVGDVLDPGEQILHNYIQQETNIQYATALIGKWHLSGNRADMDPEVFGMDYYSGILRGSVNNYYQWDLSENGASMTQTGYVTKVLTDLSIDWINNQTKPWFLWLAYNAPHTPFHVPPREMHSQGNLTAYRDGLDPNPYYFAAIEAMDFQIGRLLSEMSEEELDNTIILFLGDNGTPRQVVQAPYSNNSSKGSLNQGGINVPMFISGKGVTRVGEDVSLITSTDLFATIAELAGVSVSEFHDSKSFKTLLTTASVHREIQYSEINDGTNDLWAVSNGSYKLIGKLDQGEEFYFLENDPYEQNNLIESGLNTAQEAIKSELERELMRIRN